MEGCDFFAVYDGHSGEKVCDLCQSILYKKVQEAIHSLGAGGLTRTGDIANLLKRTFIEHNKYLASVIDALDDSGSTATVGIVTPTHIIMAYIGDSPCFLMNPQTGYITEQMGRHEPSLASETARIEQAGGFVEIDEGGTPRVDGMLAVSRAFGDFSLNWKGRSPPAGADWTKMKVTAHPDVVVWNRPESGILAIMSDGLVETDSSILKPLEQVAHDVQKALIQSLDLNKAVETVLREHVLQDAAPKSYSGDDLSLILVDVGIGGGRIPPTVGGAAVAKPLTRKSKGRRVRARTGKKSRLIKIFSC